MSKVEMKIEVHIGGKVIDCRGDRFDDQDEYAQFLGRNTDRSIILDMMNGGTVLIPPSSGAFFIFTKLIKT